MIIIVFIDLPHQENENTNYYEIQKLILKNLNLKPDWNFLFNEKNLEKSLKDILSYCKNDENDDDWKLKFINYSGLKTVMNLFLFSRSSNLNTLISSEFIELSDSLISLIVEIIFSFFISKNKFHFDTFVNSFFENCINLSIYYHEKKSETLNLLNSLNSLNTLKPLHSAIIFFFLKMIQYYLSLLSVYVDIPLAVQKIIINKNSFFSLQNSFINSSLCTTICLAVKQDSKITLSYLLFSDTIINEENVISAFENCKVEMIIFKNQISIHEIINQISDLKNKNKNQNKNNFHITSDLIFNIAKNFPHLIFHLISSSLFKPFLFFLLLNEKGKKIIFDIFKSKSKSKSYIHIIIDFIPYFSLIPNFNIIFE
jgi:hypothetical protein